MNRLIKEEQIIVSISDIVFDKIPQIFPFSDFQRMSDSHLSKLDLIESVEININDIDGVSKSDLLDQMMKERKFSSDRIKEIKSFLKEWIQEEFKDADIKLTDEARDAVLNMIISAMKETDRILVKEQSV